MKYLLKFHFENLILILLKLVLVDKTSKKDKYIFSNVLNLNLNLDLII